MLAAVCLCLAICASSGAYGGETREGGSTIGDSGGEASIGAVSAGGDFERLDDFVVRLPDDQKKGKILVCSVTVQLNRGMRLPEERAGLRKIIYTVLKERSGATVLERALREEIKVRLNGYMGEERVHSVYLTKFVVL
ncbi:MAG: flagellar basal body-associated FliL family protein [Deltaproteobacteria bacterium]|nr:flagellar basal body-associated FliL family protein [Deltaproteobacteria bacterium]